MMTLYLRVLLVLSVVVVVIAYTMHPETFIRGICLVGWACFALVTITAGGYYVVSRLADIIEQYIDVII